MWAFIEEVRQGVFEIKKAQQLPTDKRGLNAKWLAPTEAQKLVTRADKLRGAKTDLDALTKAMDMAHVLLLSGY